MQLGEMASWQNDTAPSKTALIYYNYLWLGEMASWWNDVAPTQTFKFGKNISVDKWNGKLMKWHGSI